jgi:ABC-type transport system involved in cytochrome c biogenesis permease component
MSNTPLPLNQRNLVDSPATRATADTATWWIIFTRELADLWVGGKALILSLIYTLVLGFLVYVLAYSEELSLIPPKELVYEGVKNAMAISLVICMIIGADTISGERERGTLESLLLTPTSRFQIMLGKFLAAISFWPIALLIVIPYLWVLSQGDEILVPTILWGGFTGTLLAVAYTGIGMLASFWSNTNKTSYFISLGMYIFFLVPAQLPGTAQTGAAGQFLQWINPLAAVNHFLSKHLVNYRPLSEFWTWLIPPVVFFLLILAVIFLYAAPGLRLEAGREQRKWLSSASKIGNVIGLLVIISLALAFQRVAPAKAAPIAQAEEDGMQIAIDTSYSVVKTGDTIRFTTAVTNMRGEQAPPLIVAMNIINLDAKGDTVDPEDWSPQRTQYIETLSAGQSASQEWIINTILDGEFMVYMVLIPTPESQDTTTKPVASSGIHLTVTPFTRVNPGGVLPFVIGIPVLLASITFVVYRQRRQKVDLGS